MSRINQKRTRPLFVKKSHKNWMGGESYKIGSPIYNLRLAASSCFFGEPMYYHQDKDKPATARFTCSTSKSVLDGKKLEQLREKLGAIDPQEWRSLSPKALMEQAIDKALEADAEGTLQEAVRLRNEDYIRTTPQVILVRAANNKKLKGTGLVRKFAPDIIKRADELSVCLAYQLSTFGKPVPNSLKRALSDCIGRFDEYQLAKYRQEARDVKLVDVVNLVHPTKNASVGKLVKGELKTTDTTWEAIRSAGGSWEKAIDVMGHMALLRNLRNLGENGVDEKLYLDKLVEGAKTGKQLPFRYYSAYKACEGKVKPQVLDAIEQCLEISLEETPKFSGRTVSLCDNSGSAQGATTSELGSMKISEIANLTGVITGKVSDEGWVGVFGDRLTAIPVRKKSSVFDTLKECSKAAQTIGQGTENGIWLFFKDAIRSKEHWDNIFVYSDMQAGHGGLYGTNPGDYHAFLWHKTNHIDVASLVMEYRNKVNPNVNVFLVQVAGYQDTIVPEFYKKTYILGGWGDGILKFAHNMTLDK